MTTTPLPPQPMAFGVYDDTLCYTGDDMTEYAQQARADLEAEVARLREALEKYIAWCDAESDGKVDFWERVQMCRDSEAAARAALEGKP